MGDPWAALRNCKPIWNIERRITQQSGRIQCRTCERLLAETEFYTGGERRGRKKDCRVCYKEKVNVRRRQLTE